MSEAAVKRVRFTAQLRTTETVEGVPSAEDAEVDNDDLNAGQQVYDVSSTPLIASFRRGGGEYTLGTGDTTIDLTALSGTQDDIDATGDKVQFLHITTDDENSGDVTIKPGASNPYNLFGASNEADFGAGIDMVVSFGETLDDVAAGAKMIDLSGTAGDKITLDFITGPQAGT